MKVGILGCRGIPNHYGGFEQFAENLSVGLTNLGTDVWVYCSHNHPYNGASWQGVKLIHCYDPEFKVGQAGQYIYDFNCITDSRHREFDILLQLGYTSNSVWFRLLPKKPVIITNMDGLEWKRKKYSKVVRYLLKYSEKLAVTSSHHLVSDSEVIKEYLQQEYQAASTYIPYGADILEHPDISMLEGFELEAGNYCLLIARLQPDNHIEEIIRGMLDAGTGIPLLVIGNNRSRHGRYLRKMYQGKTIRFHGAEFNKRLLDNLRHFARIYFHGHSAGGTNPSLLEAMAAKARICAHDNPFNRSVLGGNALFFTTSGDITGHLQNRLSEEYWQPLLEKNLVKINTEYRWERIAEEYYKLFVKSMKQCPAATPDP
jgi:glycosyltransferase involved in cell wall biosynthesis